MNSTLGAILIFGPIAWLAIVPVVWDFLAWVRAVRNDVPRTVKIPPPPQRWVSDGKRGARPYREAHPHCEHCGQALPVADPVLELLRIKEAPR